MPSLEWIGKNKVINHHQDVPFRVLDRKYSFNADGQTDTDNKSKNMIIRGDNLEALKALLPQYEGKVKCIYIDPPYNTGNENWVYNDNVNDPKIKKWLGEVVGKEGEDLSRHDKWLCMMYPRLKLLYKLLADDGAIFISIDDNEQANLRLICDEIFGMNNGIGPIIQNKMNAKNDTVNIQKNHEFIFVYRKCAIWENGTKMIPTLVNCKYQIKDIFEENGEYYYMNDSITTRGEGGILNARPNLGYTVYYNPETEVKIAVSDYNIELAKTSNDFSKIYTDNTELIEKGFHPIRPPKVRGKLGCWTWQLQKFNDENHNIVISGKTGAYAVKKRTFVEKNEVFQQNSKLKYSAFTKTNSRSIIEFSTNEGTIALNDIMDMPNAFDNPKNIDMIHYLLNLIMDKDSIILDSFAGSGTTAHAVLNMNKQDGGNRQFILVEMEEYADSITAERAKRVIQGYDFTGEKKTEIYSQKLTSKNLLDGEKLIKEAEKIIASESKNFDSISKPKIDDNHLKVIGTKKYTDKMDGTGGDFSFYDLGEALLLPNGNLNEAVGTNRIQEYVYFMETKEPLNQMDDRDNPYYLGKANDTAYYFYYEQGQMTTLNRDFLSTIGIKTDGYIIYADKNAMSLEEMRNYNIVFKKIPRDIAKL